MVGVVVTLIGFGLASFFTVSVYDSYTDSKIFNRSNQEISVDGIQYGVVTYKEQQQEEEIATVELPPVVIEAGQDDIDEEVEQKPEVFDYEETLPVKKEEPVIKVKDFEVVKEDIPDVNEPIVEELVPVYEKQFKYQDFTIRCFKRDIFWCVINSKQEGVLFNGPLQR